MLFVPVRVSVPSVTVTPLSVPAVCELSLKITAVSYHFPPRSPPAGLSMPPELFSFLIDIPSISMLLRLNFRPDPPEAASPISPPILALPAAE